MAVSFLSSREGDTLGPRDREYFPLIQAECDGICAMVEQMDLMFSPQKDLSVMPLQQVLSESMSAIRKVLPMTEVVFETEAAAATQRICRAVAVTVLREAVRNAWQAAPQPVVVTSALRDREVVLRVIDQGPGFSDEGRALAFEPFYTTKPRSLGLGLSIAHKQVTALGGSVSLGRDARGNFVEFTLPCSI